MILPSIHKNGTSKEELIDQVSTARHALRTAIEALQAAAPNGRDYYPQGTQVVVQAQYEHRERFRKLNDVMEELTSIQDYLAF